MLDVATKYNTTINWIKLNGSVFVSVVVFFFVSLHTILCEQFNWIQFNFGVVYSHISASSSFTLFLSFSMENHHLTLAFHLFVYFIDLWMFSHWQYSIYTWYIVQWKERIHIFPSLKLAIHIHNMHSMFYGNKYSICLSCVYKHAYCCSVSDKHL